MFTFKTYLADCSGSTAMEYGVIASAVGIALIPVIRPLGQVIGELLQPLIDQLLN